MSFKNKFIVLLMVSGLVLACGTRSTTGSSDDNQVKAIISNVSGDAFVIRPDHKKPATPGIQLETADIIETSSGATVDLAIKGFGIIKIGAQTKVKIHELISNKKADKASLSVERGDVASFIDRQNSESEFSIRTPTAVAGVRGTSFVVSVDNNKSSIAVMDGSVALSQPGREEIILEKNSQIVIDGQTKISKSMVQPLSPGSLNKMKRLSVFHKSNVLEFNTLIDELQKNSSELTVLEGEADVEAELARRDKEATDMSGDSVARVKRADISKTLKRDTRNDPIKLDADKSYDK